MSRCLLLSLCLLLACIPTDFSSSGGNSGSNGNGSGEEEANGEYKINLLQLKVKDRERIAINIEVLKGKKLADDVEIKFTIACRAITADEENNTSATDKLDYGKALSLGAATTDDSGVVRHISNKVLHAVDADDDDRRCQVLAITDDDKEHEVGIMTVNAALRLVFELGKELTIVTTDTIFNTSECDDPKLLVLQLQTIRGVMQVITDSKKFTQNQRESSYEKIHVLNTTTNPQNLACQLYNSIVSMQTSVYAEIDIDTARGFERKNEKMWLKNGVWQQTLGVCAEETVPPALLNNCLTQGLRVFSERSRRGCTGDTSPCNKPVFLWSHICQHSYALTGRYNYSTETVPPPCITQGDTLLVYYKKELKLYKITTD